MQWVLGCVVRCFYELWRVKKEKQEGNTLRDVSFCCFFVTHLNRVNFIYFFISFLKNEICFLLKNAVTPCKMATFLRKNGHSIKKREV